MNPRFLLGVVAALTVFNIGSSSATAVAPTTAPTTQAAADVNSIRLRALQPVLDARERRQDWHQAADAAIQRIESPPLRKELNQRLAGLAPHVAKALTAQPHDDALVTIAVYREPGLEGKQAMVAVTFDGMGSEINPQVFGDILADLPNAPQAKAVGDKLVLDPQASSYLVFFLDRDGLKASDVPHDKMKQSVMLAINRQHEEAAKSEVAAQRQQNAAAQARARLQSTDATAAQQAAASEAANGPYVPAAPSYPYAIPEVVNDGYAYPGVGVPIVILPSGTVVPNNQGNGQQPRNTQEMNQKRQRFPGPGEPGGPPASGVNQPSGSLGVKQPAGSTGVKQPAASAGVRQPAGQAGQQSPPSNQRPAPPPAQREAPPQGEAPRSSGAAQRQPPPAQK